MAREQYYVDWKEFVRVWEQSSSVAEAAEKLKMPVPAVHARVNYYRKNGIPLKVMQRGRGKLDIVAIKEFLKEVRGDKVVIEPKMPIPDSDRLLPATVEMRGDAAEKALAGAVAGDKPEKKKKGR